jgi:hypothetical protein
MPLSEKVEYYGWMPVNGPSVRISEKYLTGLMKAHLISYVHLALFWINTHKITILEDFY